MVFEVMLLAIVFQSLVICWQAYRLRKMPVNMIQPYFIKREVKVEPREDVHSVPTSEMLPQPIPPLPLPRTRSNYNYYVIHKSDTDNSVPTGIYKCTWNEIVAILPNNRFPAKGIQLKGANTLEEACTVWKQHRREL